MDTHSLVLGLFFLAAGIAAYFVRWRRCPRLSFPPGPPGLPILGNLFDIPATEPWIAYKKLGDKYGDLVHLRVLTQDVIILNSYEAIKDLFEKRSQNYSNRPRVPANDMVDLSWSSAFIPYGDEWRTHRKIFQQTFRLGNISLYYPMQLMKTRELLRNVSDSPANYEQHLRTFSTTIAMAATYDYHPTPQDDPMVSNLKALVEVVVATMGSETSAILAAFPFLMYIPPWFPGATWQRAAHKGRKLVGWWLTAPVQYVKEIVADGPIASCIVGDALSRIDEKQNDTGKSIRILKEAAASSLLDRFSLASICARDYILTCRNARKTKSELSSEERLPDFSDRPRLPYIEAILRETLRWHPVVPFAIFRSVTNDDVYRGYNFLKGVMIIPNVWQVRLPLPFADLMKRRAIAHDATRYPDPFTFNPSRFIDDDGNLNDDTVSYVFGFGRRVCAGRVLADASIWSAIASMFAVFSFEAPLDEAGRPVKIEPRFTTGLTSHPERFPVRITLRLEAEKFTGLLEPDERRR